MTSNSRTSSDMAMASYLGKAIEVLKKIIDSLSKFENNYDKRFNISRMARMLNIPKWQVKEITNLILSFQEKFDTVFKNYRLQEKEIDKKIYLVAEKINSLTSGDGIIDGPVELTLSKTQSSDLNDIIYAFKYINRGKGFDLTKNNIDYVKKIKSLKENHPSLFRVNGANLVYPSEVCLEVGDKILTYKKINREMSEIKVNNHIIRFE